MTYKPSIIYQYIFWVLFSALVVIFLYATKNTLFPFIIAMVFAYLLDPLVAKLESKSLSRSSSSGIIVAMFFIIIIVVGIIIMPLIYDQFISFIHKIPEYHISMQKKVIPLYSELMEKIDPNLVEKIDGLAQNFSEKLFQYLTRFLNSIWQSGLALINFLFLIFITPIITFYLLRDWPKMLYTIEQLLPNSTKGIIKEQTQEIDFILSGYIRGQMNVCLMMAVFYSTSLSFLGLDFGLVIGAASGLLTLIPFIGPIIGFIASLSLALFQSMDSTHILILCIIFIIGPALEGNFITPKLVGERVKLHPAWIIFAVLVSTNLAGFTGMLVAVPTAAIIGVLTRFFIQQYLSSNFSK
ncbi:pheromone autoinducer 2 transporter [Rickettsiales bacterium Ac37b]|nr:pheromone autoinducer 2 transporter [Rickettsiales bacterium Ac37b]